MDRPSRIGQSAPTTLQVLISLAFCVKMLTLRARSELQSRSRGYWFKFLRLLIAATGNERGTWTACQESHTAYGALHAGDLILRPCVSFLDQALWSDREWELIHRPQCINSVISAHYPRVQQWMHQMGKDEREAFHNWPQYGNTCSQYSSSRHLSIPGSATMGYENVTGHKNYTIPWDALAMAYVTNPEWCQPAVHQWF